jgi:hypothetical protein
MDVNHHNHHHHHHICKCICIYIYIFDAIHISRNPPDTSPHFKDGTKKPSSFIFGNLTCRGHQVIPNIHRSSQSCNVPIVMTTWDATQKKYFFLKKEGNDDKS